MDYKIQSANEAMGFGEEDLSKSGSPGQNIVDGGSETISSPSSPREVGQYEILSVLGRGGMGEVLKGRAIADQKIVAIKVLDAEAYQDPELLRRFEREARAAQALDHPNIAKFYGLEYDAHGLPFIVMEYIAGDSMDRILRNSHGVPTSQLIDYVIQTARGLWTAHRRGIIHRDIKPSNLIVTPDKQVKIIDFGLAKSLWDTTMLTGTGMVVGTPRYISPEQGMGRNVDHRSDIYSLGATFYELMTRQTPFDGETAMAIMLKHINTPLVPPYMINPKVPGDVNEIICRMMAKDPGERYQDYEQLIRELESAKIHRLAKEQRTGAKDTPADALSPTLVSEALDPTQQSGPPLADAKRRPSPYLSEGLVNVDFSTLPQEKAPSRTKLYLLTAVGLFALLIVAFEVLREKPQPEQRKKSRLAQVVAGFVQKQQTGAKEDDTKDLFREDQERIRVTSSRLEMAVPKIIQFRQESDNPAELPRIRELRKRNVLTTEDSQDGWGNDFVISNANGPTGVVIAAGRDGVEGTDDDFQFSLDGSPGKVPLSLEEEQTAKEKEKEKSK